MGKTTFALNIAENAAVHLQIPVIVFSLEMSKSSWPEVALRRGEVWTITDRTEIWRKRIGPVLPALGRLSELRCLYDSPIFPRKSGRARRIQAKHGLGLIVIDYCN